MNKQEAIKGIKSEKYNGVLTYEEEAYNNGLKDALGYVEKIDMPERPVLTKEEAEWIEGLKKEQKRRPFWTKYSMLYFVTRAGFGYGFSYDHDREDREVELKHYSHEIHAEKKRLTNAILYGYEVEKEKLYKVSLKKNGLGIGIQQQDGSFKEKFTKTELSECGFDDLDVYEIKEVEE